MFGGEWLAVHADAYDWIELPNVLGMVMHADNLLARLEHI